MRIADFRERLNRLSGPRLRLAIALVLVAAGGWFGAGWLAQWHRTPSIFDTPADDLASYLGSAHFSTLPLEERLAFLRSVIERFRGMEQSESAATAAFLAGLTGDAREQLRQNVRILAKDILVEGADGYLRQKSDASRANYLDEWVVKWAKFGREMEGRGPSPRSDQEILENLHRDATRDAERGFQVNPEEAQQMLDFWQSDIAGAANPAEQGKLFQFLPALRMHLLKPRS